MDVPTETQRHREEEWGVVVVCKRRCCNKSIGSLSLVRDCKCVPSRVLSMRREFQAGPTGADHQKLKSKSDLVGATVHCYIHSVVKAEMIPK